MAVDHEEGSFDLAALSNWGDWSERKPIVYGFSVIFLGLAVWAGWKAVTCPASCGESGILTEVGVIVFAVLLSTYSIWYAHSYLGRQASRLTVGPHGFTLTFPNGSKRELSWSDPSLRFSLDHGKEGSVPFPEWTYILLLRGSPDTLLTKNAYEGLLRAARRHGLSEIMKEVSGQRGHAQRHLFRAG